MDILASDESSGDGNSLEPPAEFPTPRRPSRGRSRSTGARSLTTRSVTSHATQTSLGSDTSGPGNLFGRARRVPTEDAAVGNDNSDAEAEAGPGIGWTTQRYMKASQSARGFPDDPSSRTALDATPPRRTQSFRA
eukprot:TRINITY_DN12559_c0_g1_i1.p2 TRINITY_DN12559_c0_g1~~TRINITY_DN12559_c0_g1_i1.p2  ORF type:complete len:151 (-),score=32.86 TRINITY_DN12559_c0_g1_i1:636-1040(-)